MSIFFHCPWHNSQKWLNLFKKKFKGVTEYLSHKMKLKENDMIAVVFTPVYYNQTTGWCIGAADKEKLLSYNLYNIGVTLKVKT